MNRRVIAILVLVVGILMLAIVAIIFITQQDEPQPTPPPVVDEDLPPDEVPPPVDAPPVATPPMVEVVVSLQTIPRGFQITADILEMDMRRVETVGTNVITNPDEIIGLYARTDIFQGETLTRDAFVSDPTLAAVNEYGPSALIPVGFLAQAVPVRDAVAHVAFGISEGDYVDILIIFNLYRIDEQFQTYLENDAVFYLESLVTAVEAAPPESEEDTARFADILFFVSPFGRFEELPTGDLAMVSPREFQRPIPVGMVLQNAKVIQVGVYEVPEPASAQLPTPTPPPEEGVEPTPTPVGPVQIEIPVPTPRPREVMVVALSPQQQLFLKYAIEVGAQIDFALRGVNDMQLYAVENVHLDFLLNFFNIEVPPNFGYTLESPFGTPVPVDPEATPVPTPVPPGAAE